MVTLYLAGPIFSDAETSWLRSLKSRLESQWENTVRVIWPFEITPKHSDDRASEVLRICSSGLDEADLLVALLDGTQVDDGTAWEIGYFYHANVGGERIIAIRTDTRCAGETSGLPVNTLIAASCGVIVRSVDELLQHLTDAIGRVTTKG
jgi:nucleoside 2-deoxyribosyltransferase